LSSQHLQNGSQSEICLTADDLFKISIFLTLSTGTKAIFVCPVESNFISASACTVMEGFRLGLK